MKVLWALNAAAVAALVVTAIWFYRPLSGADSGPAAVTSLSRSEFEHICGPASSISRCLSVVGKPDKTQRSGSDELWYFEGKTFDPLTRRVDRSAQVVIRDGLVRSINFY